MSESRQIARRAGVVAAGTLASRVLGFARDAALAAVFPAARMDAFVVAFTIPNTLRRLLGEGDLTAAFVPVLAETTQNDGEAAARIFVRRVLGALSAVLALVTVLGIVFAPAIVMLFASGYRATPGKFELTVTLTRGMFPYIACMGLAALAMGVLNSRRRFFATAFSPVWLNVALLAAMFGLAPVFGARGIEPVLALAVGVAVGGVLQVAFQLPSLRREGFLAAPAWDLSDPSVRKVARLMIPGFFGLAVYQIDVMLSRSFLSGLPEGSNTYFYLAMRLTELPQGLFTMAIASAALPSLSAMAARGESDALKTAWGDSMRLSLFFAIPAAAICVALAVPLVAVVFQRGEFTHPMALQTAKALVCQGAGIVVVAAVRQTVPMFFALQDTRTPRTLAAVNLAVFIGACLALRGPMQHAGISLAVTLAATVQVVLLVALLRRKVGKLGLRRVASSVLKIGVASAVMTVVAYGVATQGAWASGGTLRNTAVLLGALACGGAAFLLVARVARCPELGELRAALRRRGSVG